MRLTVSTRAYTPNFLQCKCPMTRSSSVRTSSVYRAKTSWSSSLAQSRSRGHETDLICQVLSRLAQCVQSLLHMTPNRRGALPDHTHREGDVPELIGCLGVTWRGHRRLFD